MSLSDRIKIAKRVAQELKEGEIVNLGVGIPTIIPDYLDDKKVYLQSENGLLGMGPTPSEEDIDMDLISASKKPVSMDRGASLFDSSDSFLMIRGGHIDTAVLGALQVDETGEVANWAVPGETILGVGGAMDLVAGARRMIIASMHLSKEGSPKIVKRLSFPSSGTRKADMIVTEHAVFKFLEGKMYLIETLSDLSIEALREMTDAEFHVLEKNKMETN
ncbi:3-oxoacid CoA-transferase subunit B [Cytobacillus firmus]|uniref:3-oxoacid CoA-transferase subunit B n=1 Tax=Cytobacillus firmus TaxID=1399 RepID=UPI0024C19F82|nr:3-oxoacid CoA-transferase subunit B [Cytobacillus firmus]WHY61551.1 3-oxoacid CoA-transferase subunit B [Cytobacillus firmus]